MHCTGHVRFSSAIRPRCQNAYRSCAAISCLLLLVLIAGTRTSVVAAEPPQVTAELELWLEAGHIKQQGGANVASGDSLERWPDASGRMRDMVQPDQGQRPTLMQLGDSWFARFDGEDDCLRFQSDKVSLSAATIWMVAAPHRNPGDFCGLFAANEAGRRDYESGLNIDLGPGPTREFGQLNVEGRGFGGGWEPAHRIMRFWNTVFD